MDDKHPWPFHMGVSLLPLPSYQPQSEYKMPWKSNTMFLFPLFYSLLPFSSWTRQLCLTIEYPSLITESVACDLQFSLVSWPIFITPLMHSSLDCLQIIQSALPWKCPHKNAALIPSCSDGHRPQKKHVEPIPPTPKPHQRPIPKSATAIPWPWEAWTRNTWRTHAQRLHCLGGSVLDKKIGVTLPGLCLQ